MNDIINQMKQVLATSKVELRASRNTLNDFESGKHTYSGLAGVYVSDSSFYGVGRCGDGYALDLRADVRNPLIFDPNKAKELVDNFGSNGLELSIVGPIDFWKGRVARIENTIRLTEELLENVAG